MLSGVSAGVIGLDAAGPHRAAQPRRRRAAGASTCWRRSAATWPNVVPEFAPLLPRRATRRNGRAPARCRSAPPAHRRTLLVRIARARLAGERAAADGFVVTFDDITELQSAQRKAAWADVARRIAHEIKNPLTPIQLSAERLKRRFAQRDHLRPRDLHASAPTPSSAMSAISAAWWTNSPPSRACRSPVIKPEDVGRVVREAMVLPQHRAPRDRLDAPTFPSAARSRPATAG